MKLPSPRRQHHGEPLSPLIDVVFLLLVFFMLIGTLTPPEPLPVHPPQSQNGATAANSHPTLLVSAAGRLAFEGHEIEPSELRALLDQRLSDSGSRTVTVKADAAVATGTVLGLIKSLREIGIDRISLLTIAAKP